MTRIGINGAAGRMGLMLIREVHAHPQASLSAANESPGSAAVRRDAGELAGLGQLGVSISSSLEDFVAHADVIIDFSSPEVLLNLAPLACAKKVGLVVGTTGLEQRHLGILENAAKSTAVLWSPNMSIGVNTLLQVVGETARMLGPDYDLEVVEAHHRHKKDAPSGTALRLAEELAAATKDQGALAERAVYGRHGMQPRQHHEIGIHAVRGGEIVGDHTVYYCGEHERIEITHRAGSRHAFAQGAVRAAVFLHSRPAGLYTMRDVLGLASRP